MFYEISQKIKEKIDKAENILINLHKHPDYDSFSSALALSYVLNKMGKKNKILSCQGVSEYFYFLRGAEKIEHIDYAGYDFKDYDLFIIPDTGSEDRVTGSKDVFLPVGLEKIIIDHHKTNTFNKDLRLLDIGASSTTEVLYGIFADWGTEMDQSLATYLLTGIMGDTVFLRYCEDSKKTLKVVADLVNRGADKDRISENFYERYEFDTIKLLGEFLNRMEKRGDFIWSAIPYGVFEKYGKPEGVREMAADLFFRGIKGAEFGIAILEFKKNEISLSFRSKKNTDVSGLASLFGGGGHKNAAGATIEGSFEKTVPEIISKISSVRDADKT